MALDPVTPAFGAKTAGDMVGQTLYVKHKLAFGADGSATDATAATPMPTALGSQTRTDTFTAVAASGTVINCLASPPKYFGIQVTPTGAVTSWTVTVEGSMDGLTFTTLATHTNVAPGTGKSIWLSTPQPVLYFRLNCTALTLGAGTNVVAVAVATQ